MAVSINQSIDSSPIGSNSDKIEPQVKHYEEHGHRHNNHHEHHLQSVAEGGFATDTDELPKGYFTSLKFIGTFLGIGMNLMASTAGFSIIAPVLGQIDAAIGPGPVIWLALVFTLGLAIGLTLVGRLTDIFGRRWFFISGVGLLG